MRIVADESVDRQIVERLRQDGHDVWNVSEEEPSISDNAVLDRANERRSLLLTADKDFGELAFHRRLTHGGVVLIRLPGLAPSTKADIVATVLREHRGKVLGRFTVISPGIARIRPSFDGVPT